MKQRILGRSGISVSEICLGTMTFGSMADEATSTACLDMAYDAGVDFIDIAEIYPVPPDRKWAGASETICGKWLADKPRDSLIVATKVAGPTGGWFRGPVREGKTGLDRHNIERAVEDSLRRLRIDYIDLYQTHWPDPNVPIEVTLEALDRLVEAGKLRAVGCSNQDPHGLMKSFWMSDRHGLVRYETIQNSFSIMQRRFEDDLAKICREEEVKLLPYSPIGGGVLSGKYLDGEWPAGARFSQYREGEARTKTMTERFVNDRTLATAARVAEIAGDCGLSPVTFAVAWTLTRDFVASTIVGVTSVEQLGEHLAAADAKVPQDALAAVDALSKEIRHPMA
jgi:aryl-alcohol dehydrogenase-like predicted oxidoreductase